MPKEGKAEKKVRKLKDKNAPKKAVSAFMQWSQANRQQVKDQFKDIDFAGLGKKMGELWGALNEEEKKVRAAPDAAVRRARARTGGAAAGGHRRGWAARAPFGQRRTAASVAHACGFPPTSPYWGLAEMASQGR